MYNYDQLKEKLKLELKEERGTRYLRNEPKIVKLDSILRAFNFLEGLVEQLQDEVDKLENDVADIRNFGV